MRKERATRQRALPEYLAFWGKAMPPKEGGIAFHPLAYHLLDVAAVAEQLLPLFRPKWLDNRYDRLLVLLAALHDIGKLTRTFQAFAPACWPANLLGAFDPRRVVGAPRHDTLGYTLLKSSRVVRGFGDNLVALLPGSHLGLHWKPLLRAAAGHHGRPPLEDEGFGLTQAVYCGKCHELASALFKDFVELFLGVEPTGLGFDAQTLDADVDRLHWWAAGLFNLADWIASSRWFAYTAPNKTLKQYLYVARRRARAAIRKAGLKPAQAAPLKSFPDLFGFDTPTAIQQWAATVPLPPGPKLIFVEDETGSGKTETAIMLAHRMMVAGDAAAIYFAMPTQATANAMYGRCDGIVRKLFAPGETPSLALAHGKASLSDMFRNSLTDMVRPIPKTGPRGQEVNGAVECSAWIGAENRRAFFADVGAGTIDQALLGVLPAKSGPLRLFGLMRHVLIIDEAHAYDSYMMEVIKALLFFHARMGRSAIILSATLPNSMRNELARAYRAGIGTPLSASLRSQAYPLATMVTADAVIEYADEVREVVPRQRGRGRARIEVVSDYAAVLDEIVAAAQGGAAVAWVRNTVKDAVRARDALIARGLTKVRLFHARFTLGDRQDIEQSVLNTFGKSSIASERAGEVLIATQVIEQSLDLDFDLMVSDPAPVDLLWQRAGRLWRHLRPDRPLALPRFIIAAPDATDPDPRRHWLTGMEAEPGAALSADGARQVYKDIALLWRSVRIAQREGRVGDPAAIRGVVEAAYDVRAFRAHGHNCAFVPDALARSADAADERENRAAWQGLEQVLRFADGYSGAAWRDDRAVMTRLSEPTLVIRLGRLTTDGVEPWCSGQTADRMLDWAYSEVTTRQVLLHDIAHHPRAAGRVQAAQASWRRWQVERIPLIPLHPVGEGFWSAKVTSRSGEAFQVTYHTVLGLAVDALG